MSLLSEFIHRPIESDEPGYCFNIFIKQNNSGLSTYYKRRKSGVCVACEVPLTTGKVRCDDCNGDIVRLDRDRSLARMRLGLCPDCGRFPVPGQTRCAQHSARRAGYERAIYYRRKASQQCVGCGKAPAEAGRVRCGPCAGRRRKK